VNGKKEKEENSLKQIPGKWKCAPPNYRKPAKSA
jgi:hypothetical protein